MRSRRVVVAALVAVLLAVLAGCVRVPTSGPVRKVEGQPPACQNCVNVEVAPPQSGDEPAQIVQGYLRATSNYQPNYTVARQFLTRAAAEKWSPDAGATIYQGAPVVTGDEAKLTGPNVGSLGLDHTFQPGKGNMAITMRLVKENGEWRIANPTPGLLINDVSFQAFYQTYDLFFVGNNSSLVPDPIYLPTLHNQAGVASALMRALIDGPSQWLKPAVTTAIPTGTTLSVDSVTITDGIATVPLSDAVLALPDAQRSLLAAQIVYTLKQAVGVQGVTILVNQQKFRVPESDPDTLVIGVDAIPQERNPVTFVAGEQLYAVRDHHVELVGANADASSIHPMVGALGRGEVDVDSLAVSVTNTDLALVTDGRTTLRRAETQAGDVKTVLTGVKHLLRPQFTRYGEMWVIGEQGGRQRMWRSTGGEDPEEIDAPALAGSKVVNFRISPDGTRMALIRRTASGAQVGLARIVRSDTTTVNGYRALNTQQADAPVLTQMADVAWLDATDLLVLGAATKATTLAPYEVAEDASTIRTKVGGEPSAWDAYELTVLMRTQTAIVIGHGGNTWRDDGSQWLPFVDHVTTIAYPG